jgi:predicted RNA methylase
VPEALSLLVSVAELGVTAPASAVLAEAHRLLDAGEPARTLPGWIWAWSRARERTRVLNDLGSGRDKVALTDVGLATQLFTPAALARCMAAQTLDGAGPDPHLYDPCCGTGNLLVAVVLEAASRGLKRLRITGYDLDPTAAAVAQLCVTDAARDCGLDVDLLFRAPVEDGEALLGSLVWAPATPPTGVLTNPPWLYQRNMAPALRDALKQRDPASSRDLYAAFLDRCVEVVSPGGRAVVLSPRTFLAVRQYRALRERLAQRAQLTSLWDLGPGRFPALSGEKSTCALSVWTRDAQGPTSYRDLTGCALDAPVAQRLQSVSEFAAVQGCPWTFGVDSALLRMFERHPQLGDRVDITGAQNITSDNARFVRFHWEVTGVYTDDATPPQRDPHYRPYAKGGALRRYAGNLEHVVDWSQEAREHYSRARTATLLKPRYWYREGITYTDLTTHGFHARLLPAGAVFDKAGPALFPQRPEDLLPLLGALNSPLVQALLGVLNSSLHTQVADVRALPMPRKLPETTRAGLAAAARTSLRYAQLAETRRETSPGFAQTWLDGVSPDGLEDQFAALAEVWVEERRAAQAAHDLSGRLVAAWYGLDAGVALPEQRPVPAAPPSLREALAQRVATDAARLALRAPGPGRLDLDALTAATSGWVRPSELTCGLGESLRDHMLGGSYWKRHLKLHRRSPRFWLLSAGPRPRLVPFVQAAQRGLDVSGDSSRRAWRAMFGCDPR